MAKERRKRAKRKLIFLEIVESKEAEKKGLSFIFFSREKGKVLSFLSKKEKG